MQSKSKIWLRRLFCLLCSLVLVLTAGVSSAFVAEAKSRSELESEKSKIQSRINSTQSKLNSLSKQKKDTQEYINTLQEKISLLQDKISNLESDKSALQSEIDATQAKIEKTLRILRRPSVKLTKSKRNLTLHTPSIVSGCGLCISAAVPPLWKCCSPALTCPVF